MSRRVLLVCYYFPPLGMGGIGRPLNLFQELPHKGWECDILTVKPVAYRGYEWELVETLDRARIFRSGSLDPQRILYLLGVRKVKAATIERARATSSRFFPDSKIGWVGPAIRRGRKLLKSNDYDVIMSSSPPVSCHMVARQLSVQFDIPWVADFRDYWSVTKVEQTYQLPSLVERGNDLLDDIRRNAVRVTAVNQSIADYVGNGIVIRNAFHESFAQAWKEPPDNAKFRLGILGHGVDRESWLWLVRLLAHVQQEDQKLVERTELIQVGQADNDQMMNDLSQRGIKGQLKSHGHLSRSATIEALNTTHAVYLGMSQPEGLQFVPGRVYDLLASGRPIISNADPKSEIAKIITESGNGWCFSHSEIDLASKKLSELAGGVFSGDSRITVRPEYARPYGSRRQAELFAELFGQII